MIPNAPTSLDFGLGETADMMRDSVRNFAESMIVPLASETDKNNEFPMQLWLQMGELGVLGITVEEEYGGAGMGYLEHCIAMEEISRASASVGLSYGAHSNLCVNQIRRNGRPPAPTGRRSPGRSTLGTGKRLGFGLPRCQAWFHRRGTRSRGQ